MSALREILPEETEARFGIEESFFSKTDKHGVILSGNETFVRISGYSKSELIGASHNIIRHPDMPKVVFKLLWDTIQAGKPIVAYVKNLARDRSYYWVLATVFPTGDQYVSIRIKPSSSYFSFIPELYRAMLDAEKTGGMEAAGKGLLETLGSKGFENYESFMITVLHEEMKSQDLALRKTDADDRANEHEWKNAGMEESDFLRGIYRTSKNLEECFGQIFSKIDHFISLNLVLQQKSNFVMELAGDVRLLSLNASVESARIGEIGASLAVLAQEMRRYSDACEADIHKINEGIHSVASELKRVIFNISAAKLQIQMIIFFVKEALVKQDKAQDPGGHELTEARENCSSLLGILAPFAQEAISITTALKVKLFHLIEELERLQATIRALELLHVNGVIESVRVNERGKGFEVIFVQMLASVQRAKGELKEFRKSILLIADDADKIIKLDRTISDSVIEVANFIKGTR